MFNTQLFFFSLALLLSVATVIFIFTRTRLRRKDFSEFGSTVETIPTVLRRYPVNLVFFLFNLPAIALGRWPRAVHHYWRTIIFLLLTVLGYFVYGLIYIGVETKYSYFIYEMSPEYPEFAMFVKHHAFSYTDPESGHTFSLRGPGEYYLINRLGVPVAVIAVTGEGKKPESLPEPFILNPGEGRSLEGIPVHILEFSDLSNTLSVPTDYKMPRGYFFVIDSAANLQSRLAADYYRKAYRRMTDHQNAVDEAVYNSAAGYYQESVDSIIREAVGETSQPRDGSSDR